MCTSKTITMKMGLNITLLCDAQSQLNVAFVFVSGLDSDFSPLARFNLA
jgi:hypothetical protein